MQTEIKASVCVCVEACMRMHAPSHSVMFNSLWPHGLQPTRLLCPYNFSGKNTGVGCHFFLWGIFLIQGLNSHPLQLLHWQVYSFWLFLICFNLILFYFIFWQVYSLPLCYLGSPRLPLYNPKLRVWTGRSLKSPARCKGISIQRKLHRLLLLLISETCLVLVHCY